MPELPPLGLGVVLHGAALEPDPLLGELESEVELVSPDVEGFSPDPSLPLSDGPEGFFGCSVVEPWLGISSPDPVLPFSVGGPDGFFGSSVVEPWLEVPSPGVGLCEPPFSDSGPSVELSPPVPESGDGFSIGLLVELSLLPPSVTGPPPSDPGETLELAESGDADVASTAFDGVVVLSASEPDEVDVPPVELDSLEPGLTVEDPCSILSEPDAVCSDALSLPDDPPFLPHSPSTAHS